MAGDIPQEIRDRIARVTNMRARRLLELIVEHGEVTTEQLTNEYGYNHPPRAKKDAMDLGFPIVARSVRSSDGSRSISAYSLDLNAAFVEGRAGRGAIPKVFRDRLLARANGRCAVCGGAFTDRALQVDHRVPYEIVGESDTLTVEDFQMLCGSCNRSKSWTCERDCPNWTKRDPAICTTCIWASPEAYDHIAMIQRRQVTLTWDDYAVVRFDEMKAKAEADGVELAEYLRRLIDGK